MSRQPYRMHAPLDPECPAVQEFRAGADDPISIECGCWGEISDDFEARHLTKCARCREYGCANIEVEGP